MSEIENELLPLVHQSWSSLLPRLRDHEYTVRLEALNLLQSLATLSGDFVKQRVIKDVLPRLRECLRPEKIMTFPEPKKAPKITKPMSFEALKEITLQHMHANSKLKDSEVISTPRSVEFKVQKSTLETLAVLTTHCRFNDEELYKLIKSSYKYLHKDMHEDMQRPALYLYRALIGVNSDLMWVVLHSLGGKLIVACCYDVMFL